MDRTAVQILFTYIGMQYGIPKIDINNINNLSAAPVSKYLAKSQTIGANFDKDTDSWVLTKIMHNGRLESKILKNLESDNKLYVFK